MTTSSKSGAKSGVRKSWQEGDKFCGAHLQPEYFPITYQYCPYCGEELELVPELKDRKQGA